MMDQRRLLWRYEAGLLRREIIDEWFREELAALVERFRARKHLWAHLNRPGSKDLEKSVAFDAALAAARREAAGGRFRESSKYFRDALNALKHLELAGATKEGLDDARTAAKRLGETVGQQPMPDFATVAVVARLLAKAEQLLEAAEYGQAQFVARMCCREVERLLRIGDDPSTTMTLGLRIDTLRKLEVRLRGLMPWNSSEPSILPVLVHLEKLTGVGHVVLAEHLMDDLEAMTASKSVFLAELERELVGESRQGHHTVAEIISGSGIATSDSWRTATERLIDSDLRRLNASIQAFGHHLAPPQKVALAFPGKVIQAR